MCIYYHGNSVYIDALILTSLQLSGKVLKNKYPKIFKKVSKYLCCSSISAELCKMQEQSPQDVPQKMSFMTSFA